MKFFILIIITLEASAHIAWDYGASSTLFNLNGMTNFDPDDSANNFALPALSAFSEQSSFSTNLSYVYFDMDEVKNIVIASEINNASDELIYGDYQPITENALILSLHGSGKIFRAPGHKINFSFYAPVQQAVSLRSLDPFLPEYPLLNRLDYFSATLSYAVAFERFSVALGFFTSFRSSGETVVVAKTSGSSIPSSAEISQDARLSLAPHFSFYVPGRSNFYFNFQEESSSEVKTSVDSFIFNGASVDIQWDLFLQAFYTPRSYKMGADWQLGSVNLLGQLEYQDWSGYQGTRIELTQTGGVLRSSTEENNFNTKNILIPTVALQYEAASYKAQFSLKHSQSPLDLHDEKSGNVIDLDKTIVAAGLSHLIKTDVSDFWFTWGVQYHYMTSQRVTKRGPDESGNPSSLKIGTGGYTGDGKILATSFGINWVL